MLKHAMSYSLIKYCVIYLSVLFVGLNSAWSAPVPLSPTPTPKKITTPTPVVISSTVTPTPASCKLVGGLEPSCTCAENIHLGAQLTPNEDNTFSGTVTFENRPNPFPEGCKIAIGFSGPGIVKTSGDFVEGYNRFWFTVNPDPTQVRGPWMIAATPVNCGACRAATFTLAIPYLNIRPDDGDWVVHEKRVMSDMFEGTLMGIPSQCTATWVTREPESIPVIRLDRAGDPVPMRNMAGTTIPDTKMKWLTEKPKWFLQRAFWFGRDDAWSYPEDHPKPLLYYQNYMCLANRIDQGAPEIHYRQSRYNLRFKGYVTSGRCQAVPAISDEVLEVRAHYNKVPMAVPDWDLTYPIENFRESRSPTGCCTTILPNVSPVKRSCKIHVDGLNQFQYTEALIEEEKFHCQQYLGEVPWDNKGGLSLSCPRVSTLLDHIRARTENQNLTFCVDYINVHGPDTMACARSRSQARRAFRDGAVDQLIDYIRETHFKLPDCFMEAAAKYNVGLTRFNAGYHYECAYAGSCIDENGDVVPRDKDGNFVAPPEPCGKPAAGAAQ